MKYQNPVISGFYPDPSVIRVGRDYYLVTSSFEYFPGVPIFYSHDLVNWEQIGHCLTRKSQLDLTKTRCSGGIFAPTLRYHDGTFYMVTTNVDGGGNFYVYTTDPRGVWSEPVWLDEGEFLGFDPSFLFDDDGRVYYCRREGESVVQAEIDITTGEGLTDMKVIDTGRCSTDIEGPHLYKINGMYYLMCAEGGTRRGHMETIAKSNSPWGPFERCPHNPILTQRHVSCGIIRDTGHGELIEDHQGNWWIMFLGTRHHTYDSFTILGRETFLAPVTWDDDSWPVVNDGKPIEIHMKVTRNEMVQKKTAWTQRDDFDSLELNLYWNHLRNPIKSNYSLTERPGYLRLKGSASILDDEDAVTFLGRRQQHFNCCVKAKLDFDPNEEHEEAGLVAIMNASQHYEIGITKINAGRFIFVRRRMEDLSLVVASEMIDDGDVHLKIEADAKQYAFSYKMDGKEEKQLATALCKYLASELTLGFTGVYFGMYATGNGKVSTSMADFDNFSYQGSNGE